MFKNGDFAMRATAWVAAIGAIGVLSAPHLAAAASLTQVTSYGNDPLNPNLGMWVYVPDHVATKPGILVAAHGCNGSGPVFHSSTEFASLADKYGFIVIYPSSLSGTGGSHCFDVASTAATTRTGHGDAASVVAMVNYVVSHYNGDPTRVFATGFSSGAMFTQVVLAVYPDVFAGGAPFAGVPFGCLSVQTTDQSCASGQVSQTAQEWGAAVRAVYPDFPGPRPRVQIWHGTTDSVLNIKNLGEEFKQWSDVLGLSPTPVSTAYLAFPNPYGLVAKRTRYGGVGPEGPLETISVALADHSLPMADMAALAIHFFGLDANADLVPDTQAPSVPANVGASNVTATGLTLTWSASTDDTGVAFYLVSRKAVSDASPAAPVASLSGTTTSTSIYGLSASTAYTCWVQAQDKAGNISNVSTTLQVTTADAPGGGSAGGGGGSAGGGGGGAGGGGGGSTGGGGGGSSSGGGGGCTQGGSASDLALLALGLLALVRGRRGSRRRSPISA